MANAITPLSFEDQLALRNKAKAELERLEKMLADEGNAENGGQF